MLNIYDCYVNGNQNHCPAALLEWVRSKQNKQMTTTTTQKNTLKIPIADEDVEQQTPFSFVAAGNVKWYSYFGKPSDSF